MDERNAMATENEGFQVDVIVEEGGLSKGTVALVCLAAGVGLTAAGKWAAKKIKSAVHKHKEHKEKSDIIDGEAEVVEENCESEEETK